MHLGDYDLVAPIARGGFASVWRARHRATGVRAAIKLLPPSEATASFANEVRAVASLDHENIVALLDYGIVRHDVGPLRAGTAWMALEHCAEPLRRRDVRSWDDARAVLVPLLHALGHAHARGVLHRDIKIQNVLFAGPGDPRPGLKLVDFGSLRGPAAGPTSLARPATPPPSSSTRAGGTSDPGPISTRSACSRTGSLSPPVPGPSSRTKRWSGPCARSRSAGGSPDSPSRTA